MSSPATQSRKLRRYDDLAILDFIDRHQRATKGRSPSEQQIATGLQISNRSVAHTIVHRLVRGGFLTSAVPMRGWTAELTVTEAGRYALRVWRTQREPLPTSADLDLEVAARGAA